MGKRLLSKAGVVMSHVNAMMGKKVFVTHDMARSEKPAPGRFYVSWEAVALVRPKVGWFCGVRWKQEGVWFPGTGGYGEEYEQGYLEQMGLMPVAMVCFYPTQAPKPVPMLACLPVPYGKDIEAPVQASCDAWKRWEKERGPK